MGKNNFFQFKQFKIIQEKAAMKVGIDGVLLGAWARFDEVTQVLDIGTGTGLLALMAAQRSDAMVDAVELEPDAAEEAFANFRNSGWGSRINLHVGAFQNFDTTKRYDHIISNPPFFENSPKSTDSKRAKARHSDSLTLSELLGKAVSLLTCAGKISLILPADKEERLRILAAAEGMFINRFSWVAPDETKKPHRILAELSGSPDQQEGTLIVLRHVGSADYTDQYRELTREFYLAF